LGPLVVIGIGGIHFAIVVEGEADGFELVAEVPDAVDGGRARVFAGFDGVLFGGEAEGVPTDGMEHVFTFGALIASEDVGTGVAKRVTDMEAGARRVGEHIENEVLLFVRVV